MRVLRGGSAEIRPNKWHKFDLELDESDLQALVVKHSIDYSRLTVIQKYRLMSKQAELLVTVEMENQGVVGETTSATLMEELNTLLAKLPKVEA